MEHTGTATRTRRGTVIALALATTLVIGAPAQQALAGARRSAGQLFSLTNEARTQHGIAALSYDAQVARYALRHSKAMAAKGGIFHSADLATPLKDRSWSIAGENVGAGYSIDDLQAAFMNSPDHRKNILRPSFKNVGVGVYQDANGEYWVTVVFYG
jgi:uncharacterized protein YkwD